MLITPTANLDKCYHPSLFERQEGLPVIFLDIDGVLNCRQRHSPWIGRFDFGLDKEICTMFDTLMESLPHVGIVMSTMHRLYIDCHRFKKLFRDEGYPHIASAIVGCTPNFVDTPLVAYERGYQIDAWMKEAGARGFNITDYAIVDDNHQFHEAQCERVILTSGYRGLQEQEMDLLFERFCQEWNNEPDRTK